MTRQSRNAFSTWGRLTASFIIFLLAISSCQLLQVIIALERRCVEKVLVGDAGVAVYMEGDCRFRGDSFIVMMSFCDDDLDRM